MLFVSREKKACGSFQQIMNTLIRFILILSLSTVLYGLPYDNGKYNPIKYKVYDDGKYYRPANEGKYIPGDEGRYTYIYVQGLYPVDDGDYRYVHQVGPNGDGDNRYIHEIGPNGGGGDNGGFGGNGGNGAGGGKGPGGPNGPGGLSGRSGPSGPGGPGGPGGSSGPGGSGGPGGPGGSRNQYIGKRTYAEKFPYIYNDIKALIDEYVSYDFLTSEESSNNFSEVIGNKKFAFKCKCLDPKPKQEELVTQYSPRMHVKKEEKPGSIYSIKGAKTLSNASNVSNSLMKKLKLEYELLVRVYEDFSEATANK